jgi:hypothetical protein
MSERRVRVVRLLGQDQERPLLRLLSLRQRRRRVGLWFCSSAPNTPSFTGSYIAEEGDGGWSLTRAFNNLSLLTASPSTATKHLVLFGCDLDLVALAEKSATAIIVDDDLGGSIMHHETQVKISRASPSHLSDINEEPFEDPFLSTCKANAEVASLPDKVPLLGRGY